MLRDLRTFQRLLCGAALTAALIASMTPTSQAAGVTVTFPTFLAAGPDFATDVLGDAWDMCNAEDISPFPMESIGFSSFAFASSPCRVGGTTSTTDATIGLLYRGIYGVVNPGRNGRNFPIDTSKYRILSYKLTSGLANEDPQIFWFHNSHSDPSGNNLGFRFGAKTVNGTQIAAVDLTQNLATGTPWTTGQVVGMRFDPNSYTAGHSVSLKWVRLTTSSGAVQPISWTGGTGTATITVRDNSDGTVFTVATGVSSPYNWNYGVLPPGSYTLTVTRGTADGTASFNINTPPTVKVIDPSPLTGEDYATKVLGNPWDMNSASDAQITTLEHTTPFNFSGGQLTATNTTNDPNVTLVYSSNNAVPIDPSKYRYLTYRFQIDGAFDLGEGSVARVLWGSDSILTGPNTTTTKDILVWPGMNSYTIDLATLSASADGGLEPSGAALPWTAAVRRNLRFDPHEFVAARTFHIDDVKLTAKPVAAGFYTIRFAGGDADGHPVTVSLYYDNDTNPSNGKTAIGSAPMTAGQFGWSTLGVSPGDYYIYAEASDGVQTTGQYSEVPLEVSTSAGGSTWGDFDGDRRSDVGVFRPSNGTWYVLQSISGFTTWATHQWGASGDVPVPADYDGDGVMDIAVFRPSTGHWFIKNSSTGFTTANTYQWGAGGDTPIEGDFDGDGKADLTVFRPSSGHWFILRSSSSYSSWSTYQWGTAGDIPVPGDYDGDGRRDLGVYRPSSGHWFTLRSSTNYTSWQTYGWGTTGDKPLPGDYDGDGRTDLGIYRPNAGTWYLLKSSTNYSSWSTYQWGSGTDTPVPADYDGDRKMDVAVFRPSSATWYILHSSSNFTTWGTYQWGAGTDVPVTQ